MKRLWLFWLFFTGIAYAQSDSLVAFCRKRDTLYFTSYLDPFFSKLEAATKPGAKQAVRVVQFGDSHIQMGYFTNGILAALQDDYPAENGGFWFPNGECGGYNPAGIKFSTKGNGSCEKMVGNEHETRFGISGFAYGFEASEKKTAFEIRSEKSFITLELLVETNKAWHFQPDTLKAKIKVKKVSEHLSLVTIRLEKAAHKIDVRCISEAHAPRLRILGFRLDGEPKKGISYQKYGASGAKYSDFVNKADYFFESLDVLAPDLLIISLGTNDAYVRGETKETYEPMVYAFVQRIRTEHPKMAIIMTSQPNTAYVERKPESNDVVAETLEKVALVSDCAYWDLSEVMGGKGSIDNWAREGLAAADMLHFTQKGYAFQGKLLVEALNNAFRAYAEGR